MSDNVTKGVRSKMEGKAKSYLARCGYKRGGKVSEKAVVKKAEHTKHEKAKPAKLKEGGKVTGKKPKIRLDKYNRGGKVKEGTKINVIVAPQTPGPMAGVGAPPPMPAAPMAGPAGGPPVGAPPMPPPGMKPPGMKLGGKVHMTAGAGGAEGRLQKTAIAKKDRKGKK